MLCPKIKSHFFSFFLSCLLFAGFFNLQATSAATGNYGLDNSANEIGAYTTQVEQGNNFLNTKIGSVIGIILSFVGVIFFILMIYAGLIWMTAQGNDQQIDKAKGLLINAIIGLIIVIAAYAIVAFFGENFL